MTRIKVFLTHTETELANAFSDASLAALERCAGVVRNRSGRVLAGGELAQAAVGCQVIVAHRSAPGQAATFAQAPALLAFIRTAVDVSTIDVEAASSHGVLVTRASAGFGVAVSELALAMMLDLARGISRARMAYARGEEPVLAKGLQLRGMSLGLLGFGTIGRHLAMLARGIGMRVLAHDPFVAEAQEAEVRFTGFDEVLGGADFVVCLAPSNAATRNMMDARAFAAMKRGAFFLNLSRGELVDEDALEAALDGGRLAGVGMDVGQAADQKPSARFLQRPDVVAMPHVGGMTHQAREHQVMDAVGQVAALAAGTIPGGAVNPQAALRLDAWWRARARYAGGHPSTESMQP